MQHIKNVIDVLRHKYVERMEPPSVNSYNESAYRGIEGNKCSIGCLIDDTVYQRKFEQLDVLTLLDRFPYIVTHLQSKGLYPSEINSKFNEFLQAVQMWHDFWYRVHYENASKERVSKSLDNLQNTWENVCAN